MKEILLGFGTAFIVVLVTTPSLIKVARLKNLVDEPNETRKLHRRSVPTIGGIILFAGSIFAYALWFPWDNMNFFGSPFKFSESVKEFKFIIAALILIFFIGVKDDIIGVAPVKKLIGHFIVGFILVLMADIRIDSLHGIFGAYEIPYYVSVLLSVFTYIVVVNSFNLIDGSDGLAAGIGVITSCYLGVWFSLTWQLDMALLAFVVSGSLMAFLVFNFSPARIFMGDSGSLFIGAVTFAMSMKCIGTDIAALPGTGTQISAPVFAMSVLAYPLIDTLRVFAIRVSKGMSPFDADRNHLHHRLIDKGYTHAQTAVILYLVSALIPLACVLFAGVDPTWTFLGMLCIGFIVVNATLLLPEKKKPQVAI